MPQIHIIIQISQVYYSFCHNLWWKFSGKIFELRKKNKQTQFSLLFYFLMHFSFLPWWCTLKMEALVRFCKKMLAGFPTWEIQLLLNAKINSRLYFNVFIWSMNARMKIYLGKNAEMKLFDILNIFANSCLEFAGRHFEPAFNWLRGIINPLIYK